MVTDSRKHGGRRKKPVRVLIPHHNAGVASAENIARYIKNTNRQLSATYIIGGGGEIYQGLDESLEPYTTGNRAIDTEGITFEVANSTGAPNWEVTDKAFDALVELSIDICKRHGIKEVNYTGDKKGNIHLHEWYQRTNCPGPYLKGKMPEYARRVNEGLNKKTPTKPKPAEKTIEQMALEVYHGDHGNGHENRRKSLGLTPSEYARVRLEVNKIVDKGNKPTPAPKPPKKTISQMAAEVRQGLHGNGHENRRKSLGISAAEYAKVRAEVNKQVVPVVPKKTIRQMAEEVRLGKHGNGHANRQKSLGIDNATYAKVRAEVNRLV